MLSMGALTLASHDGVIPEGRTKNAPPCAKFFANGFQQPRSSVDGCVACACLVKLHVLAWTCR